MFESARHSPKLVDVDELPSSPVLCILCSSLTQHNQLVCAQCGEQFAQVTDTSPLDSPTELSLPERGIREETTLVGEGIVILAIGAKLLRIHLAINTSIIVGRCGHAVHNGSEEITDLTPFGTFSLGVSRQHLRLTRQGSFMFVADLKSTNGTWLNGLRLAAQAKYLLCDGDTLKLGDMMFQVRLQ
jgi:hypothetical protein